MNSTNSRLAGWDTCKRCHRHVTDLEDDYICAACHTIRRIFRNGERFADRRAHSFISPAMIRTIPALYATEHTPIPDKVLYAHYFVGRSDWYIAELDPETGLAFGYADLGHGFPEWGYIFLVELERTLIDRWRIIDRDLGFEPTTARELGIA
jgi:hypothetical protein